MLIAAFLAGLYLLSYLAIYWFLVSNRGQVWTERNLSSRLGVTARWKGATVSPFLQPTLQNVTVEISSGNGAPRHLSADEMLLEWSLRGEGGVRLRGIKSISGLARGLKIRVFNVYAEWKRLNGKRRLSLDMDRPVIEWTRNKKKKKTSARKLDQITSVANPLLDRVRDSLGKLVQISYTRLGRLAIRRGRVVIPVGSDVIELRNVSITRDLAFQPLRLVGRATAQDGTTITLEGNLSGSGSSHVSAEVFITLGSLRCLPQSLDADRFSEYAKGPASLLASYSSEGPVEFSLRLGETTLSAMRARKTTIGIPPVPDTAVLTISSFSPLSATGAMNMEGIFLPHLNPDFSSGIASASGTIAFAGSRIGKVNLAGALSHVRYSNGNNLQTSAPLIRTNLKASLDPQTGIRNGALTLFAQPDLMVIGDRKIDISPLTISIHGLGYAGTAHITARQIVVQVGDWGRIRGNLVGAVSPAISLRGTIEGRELPLDRLWRLAVQSSPEEKPPRGMVDLKGNYRFGPETKRLVTHTRIADLMVPSATMTAKRVEIDGTADFERKDSLTGSVSIAAHNLSYRDFAVARAAVSSLVSRSGSAAPIRLSNIKASCDLFSATGRAEVSLDERGPYSITYDTTLHFDDLSKTYSTAAKIMEKIQLDGVDVGGRATVRLQGGWTRPRTWRNSAQADLFGNHLLADARDIPVQWDNLDARLTLNTHVQNKGFINARAQGSLSNFVALAGDYDLDLTGRGLTFALDGVWNRPARSLQFNSFRIQFPGSLSGRGQGFRSADRLNVTAVLTTPNLAKSYEEFLKDLIVDRWPDAANLTVDGSAQVQVSVVEGSKDARADGSIHWDQGVIRLSDEIRVDGLSADLSAGLTRLVSTESQLEPRHPMRIAASRIRWGSGEITNFRIQPRITDGTILWEEPISVPMLGGNARIGPVRITRPLSTDRRLQTWVHLRRAASLSDTDENGILGMPSEIAAAFPDVTIGKNILAATGAMTLHIFGGLATLSQVRVWQVFSSYPIWGGDIEFEHMDLSQVSAWLGIGRIKGNVSGLLKGLRISLHEGGKPIAFDLDLESDPGGGTISREALKMIFDMGQQASTRILLDRPAYAYGRLGLRAKLHRDRFFLWGKFKRGDRYYFMEPPSLLSRILPAKFHTVRIALNSPDRELSFEDIWQRIRNQSFERPEVEISFLQRVNPLRWLNPF